MAFLFGDLTPAPFTTNFLEELRDVIDFAASIAETDQTIVNADATREALRARADEEAARLEALVRAVLAAAEGADKGREGSVVATLAAELAAIMAARHDAASTALTAKLADDVRALEAATVAARGDYFALLEEYLLAHVPPQASQTVRVELVTSKTKKEDHYTAELTGHSDVGLAWSIEMDVPDAAWKAPLRVDRVAEGLAILVPQLSGLIKKEVKLKKVKLDRHFVTTVVRDDETVVVELRSEVGSKEGFDISADLQGDDLSLIKLGEPGDVTLGELEIADEDKGLLLELATKLHAMAGELPKKRLVTATFDRLPFDGTSDEAQPKLVQLVSRLVAKLAPVVDEIAARSRSEDELVLRVKLADARREEIFLPKSRLREKLAGLDDAHRALFGALGKALDPKPVAGVSGVELADAAPAVRSEVPPLVRRRSGNMQAVVVPPQAPVPVEPPPPDEDAGQTYRRCAALFSSAAFTSSPAEEQRHALRSMFFDKAPPVSSEDARAAYRAAVRPLQALVVVHRDPRDYELLGMAYVGSDEPEKGSEMFRKALEAERARDPSSELCGSLMRRVSARE